MTVTAIVDTVMSDTDMILVLPGQLDPREVLAVRVFVAGPSCVGQAGSCSRFWCRTYYSGAHGDRNGPHCGVSDDA